MFLARIFGRKNKLIAGDHACAPNALLAVMPELEESELHRLFIFCCEDYPYGGVKSSEFSAVLSHLKIRKKFEYSYYKSGKPLKDFLKDRKTAYILLVWGHFTAVKNGKVHDLIKQNSQKKVFCSWRLKTL